CRFSFSRCSDRVSDRLNTGYGARFCTSDVAPLHPLAGAFQDAAASPGRIRTEEAELRAHELARNAVAGAGAIVDPTAQAVARRADDLVATARVHAWSGRSKLAVGKGDGECLELRVEQAP